jgi:hypothetical protein
MASGFSPESRETNDVMVVAHRLAMTDSTVRLNDLSAQIIGAAIEVHRTIGPGLLESAYEACLYFELVSKQLKVERQKPLSLM